MKKIINFLKNWTLPVAISTGIAVYFVFASIEALDGVASIASSLFDTIWPWLLCTVLFVTFCRINFTQLRLTRWHLWVSLTQLMLVLAAVGSIVGFHLAGGTRIIMECVLTCVIAPCATASPVVTAKLDGDIEAMTSYSFVSNLLTALMISLLFPLVETRIQIDFLTSFFMILRRVCMILVAPMALAFAVRHYAPKLQRAITSIPDLAFYLWGISLSIVSGITFRNLMHASASLTLLSTIALATLGVCFAMFAIGQRVGLKFNAKIESGQGMGQKNTAFAIWVAGAYLTPVASVGPGCYILWQNIVNSLELWQHRKHSPNINS